MPTTVRRCRIVENGRPSWRWTLLGWRGWFLLSRDAKSTQVFFFVVDARPKADDGRRAISLLRTTTSCSSRLSGSLSRKIIAAAAGAFGTVWWRRRPTQNKQTLRNARKKNAYAIFVFSVCQQSWANIYILFFARWRSCDAFVCLSARDVLFGVRVF